MTSSSQKNAPAFLQNFERIYWPLVALLLIGGALARLSLPLTPFIDPDIAGYLKPSIDQFTVGMFSHEAGRNFLYPYFVSQVLQISGNFNAISLVQHLGGLLAACLMMAVWHQTTVFFPLGFASRITHRLLGLAILTSFLFSKTTLLMEHSIRPESVFPLFTVCAIFLACRYFTAIREGKNPAIICALACGLVYNAFVIYSLKPAFGLGVGVAFLPPLLSLKRLKWPLAAKGGLFALPLCLVAVTLWLPEKKLVETYDKQSNSFLPELLLCFHADIIRNEIDADLKGRSDGIFDRGLLNTSAALIDAELRHPGKRYKESLGFDADNLLYKHSLIEALRAYYQMDNEGFNRFCIHYYLAAWKHQPGKMAAKVCRQMWNFFGGQFGAFDDHGGGTIVIKERAQRSLQNTFWKEDCPPFNQYTEANKTLLSSKLVWHQQPITTALHKIFNATYLLWFVAVVAAVISLGWKHCREWAKANHLDQALLWVAYVFLFNLGNCLTIAIIHTTQVSRYTKNQLIFTLLAEASAILLLAVLIERLREGRHQSRKEGYQTIKQQ